MRLAIVMIALHGLDGQVIWVNPSEIISARAPATELLHQDIKCTLQTVDGKLINVTDVCEDVLRLIGKTRE